MELRHGRRDVDVAHFVSEPLAERLERGKSEFPASRSVPIVTTMTAATSLPRIRLGRGGFTHTKEEGIELAPVRSGGALVEAIE